ncbi:hypothetical protein Lalb_Chr06g0162671 [Lupinus albus]|uniref:Uncharacterized protein n=1 Tax=Lupinus albus TaxID=3870 RepID=A0A6A4QC04_LUPAL|nr:hypothetical protein Lalb_Chr06g0162671 [Lupinus albus]
MDIEVDKLTIIFILYGRRTVQNSVHCLHFTRVNYKCVSVPIYKHDLPPHIIILVDFLFFL